MKFFGEKPTIKEKRQEEKDRLERLKPLEEDPFPNESGVLLSNKIRFLCEDENLKKEGRALIDPFNEDNLRPAGYKLTVGDEYFMDGKYHSNSALVGGKIIIPPFQVAVIKTKETVCIPRFLIARWNIRVKFAYEGLLWVGAPQVDPGYKGHLFCPLYNLSDKDVYLKINKDAIAVMDFVKTTEFNRKDISKLKIKRAELIKYKEPIRYKDDPKDKEETRVIIEDYGIDNLNSALFTEASQKIKEIENRFNIFITIMFTALALVVSALALFFQSGENVKLPSPYWISGFVGLSIFAFFLSILQYFGSMNRKFTICHFFGIVLCIAISVFTVWVIEN